MIPQQPVEACSKTDIGLIRNQNEDVCAVNKELGFFMVADGMGGAAKGDLASSFFLQAVERVFSTIQPPANPSLKERFYACFEESQQEAESEEEKVLNQVKERVYTCFANANNTIQEHIAKIPQHKGMGCTAELLTFYGNSYVIGHIGDSRSYLLSGQRSLRQLTRDHSLVQDQVDSGTIAHNQRRSSVLKNVLTRAVGVGPNVEVDLISGKANSGDMFLLCSDGLYNMIEDDDIGAVLRFDAPISLKAEMLVNMANDNGGRDNISVTLVQIP